MRTRALVTGANGFIGRALCRRLREAGHDVIGLTRDAGSIESADTMAGALRAEVVIHLASLSYVPQSWQEPQKYHAVNVVGTANVLEYCRTRSARLVFLSSCVYGKPDTLPVPESAPARPNNPYALSKYLAEQLCEFYAAFHGVNVTIVRAFNIFGAGQGGSFLIPEILRQLGGAQIRVRDLEPGRDYLHIDDMVTALERTLGAPAGFKIFNVGSGCSVSVREVIGTIQRVAGTSLPVISQKLTRPNEIGDIYADISKARECLGWRPLLTFEQGIERTISGHLAALGRACGRPGSTLGTP